MVKNGEAVDRPGGRHMRRAYFDGTGLRTAVCTINEALGAMVCSTDAVSSGLPPGCCGKSRGSGRVPLSRSPNRLKRAGLCTAVLLISVNVVVQFSSAAKCGMEPTMLKPGFGGNMVI